MKQFCSFRLAPEIVAHLNRLAACSGLTKTEIVEAALEASEPIVRARMKRRLAELERDRRKWQIARARGAASKATA